MKKALLCGLSAALLLALVLVAYNRSQAEQPAEPDPTPSALQTEPAETSEPINHVEQISVNTRREATLMDLLELFQAVYDCRSDWAIIGESEEVLEISELEEVNLQVGANPDVIYPADIQNQYLTWKAENYGKTAPVTIEQQTTNNQQTGGGTTQTNTGTQQTTNNEQTGGNTNVIGNVDWDAHEIKDPGQSSVFEKMDNPWDTKYKVDSGGTGWSADTIVSGDPVDQAHHGSDPTQSSIFTIPDDPWDNGGVTLDYGGN